MRRRSPDEGPATSRLHRLLEPDGVRLVLCFAVALLAGGAVLLAGGGREALRAGADAGPLVGNVAVSVLLTVWIVQGLLYVALSHWVQRALSPDTLVAHLRRTRSQRRAWWSLVDAGGAVGWTLGGAVLAALLVLIGARIGYFQHGWLPVVIGGGAVATSWIVMAHTFALRYAELHADDELDLTLTGEPVLDDFVSASVLVSTLLDQPLRPRGRAANRVLRQHAVLAWLFNTVLLALSVTVLLSGFTGA